MKYPELSREETEREAAAALTAAHVATSANRHEPACDATHNIFGRPLVQRCKADDADLHHDLESVSEACHENTAACLHHLRLDESTSPAERIQKMLLDCAFYGGMAALNEDGTVAMRDGSAVFEIHVLPAGELEWLRGVVKEAEGLRLQNMSQTALISAVEKEIEEGSPLLPHMLATRNYRRVANIRALIAAQKAGA